MTKTLNLSVVFVFLVHVGFSQSGASDSASGKVSDSVRFAALEKKLVYPLIKQGKWSGVFPVEHVTEIPDPNTRYKLLFELTYNDSLVKDINGGLVEIGRIINLHVASGIPKNHLDLVMVVHGPAIYSFYNNDRYRTKYKSDNPNLKIIDELKKAGVKFIVCGQALAYFAVDWADLLPGFNLSLTAQTVLSNYHNKGYALYKIDEIK